MKSFIYKTHGVKINHVWWYEAEAEEDIGYLDGDIIYFHGLSTPMHRYEKTTKIQYSAVTDLTETIECLWGNIGKSCRKNINRAEKNNIRYEIVFNEDVFKANGLYDIYRTIYNQMYKEKGIKDELNDSLMKLYTNNELIMFCFAYYQDEPLAVCSYIYDEKHTRQAQSASCFRGNPELSKIMGQMNRGMIWHCMKIFKELGVEEYDWGGIPQKGDMNGIASFKLEFGGRPKTRYNVFVPRSIKGKIALKYILR